MKNNKVIENSEFSEDFFSTYCHNLYKFLGRRILSNKKFKSFFNEHIYNNKYELILQKANLKLIPEEYFMSVYLSIIFFIIFAIILSLVFLSINVLYSVSIFYGGVFLTAFLGVFLYNYPLVVANKRKAEIDASIPHLLPYLKILSEELNISKIIGIIDDFLIYNEVRVEFRKIQYYSDFMGFDIQNSIREAMKSSPSRELSDLMNDLVTISNSGGSIYNYLSRKLENLNSEIDAIEKKNLDTLLIFSQIYVVLLLISPLFFTVMTSILSLIQLSSNSGGTSGGTDSTFLIVALLFVLPFIYIGFMMLIYYSKPLYSRLIPIKK